jgi:hypothetical protein
LKRRSASASWQGILSVLVLGGLAAAAAGCKSTAACNGGTVLVTVTFDATTSAADSVDVSVSVAGGAAKTTTLPHMVGNTNGSVEVDFPTGSGYPQGQSLDVTIVAKQGGSVLGTTSGAVAMLPSGCGTLAITFGVPGTGGAGAAGDAGGGGHAGGGSGGAGAGDGGGGNGGAGARDAGGESDGPTTGCTSGTSRSCAADGYLGNCAGGTETCAGGKWSACSIQPMAADSCATKGDDATCNGTPNEGCTCLDVDPARSCAAGGALGNCAAGTETCSGGKWGACSIQPAAADSCKIKGDDANCNGTANDGCPCVNGDTQACGPAAVGICKQGTQTCAGGAWGTCQGAVTPAARDCTSTADNDCDGRPDNTIDTICKCGSGTTQSCGAHPGNDGYGPCKAGTQSCVVSSDKTSSTWGTCTGAVGPASADTCTAGDDSNCDGTANEGCACISTSAPRSCSAAGALGNCALGTQSCTTAGTWGACSIQPASMDSCAVKGDDANCNGIVNEGCSCVTGDTQPCGPAAVGICKPGTSTCTSGVWGACMGAVNPAPRDCTSALDNNCDGVVDNTIDSVCQCASGNTQVCGAHPGKDGNGPCKAGSQSCVIASDKTSSSWGICTGSVGPASADTCVQGNDNNCSGTPNDGCLCINNVTTKACGYCNNGKQTCLDGTVGSYSSCSGASGQPFTALTLENGWMGAPFSTATPAAALDCSGIVQLKGAMYTSGTNLQAFALPSGLIPSGGAIYTTVDGINAAKVQLYIDVNGNGTTFPPSGTASDTTGFTSLEGVSFPVSSVGYTAVTLLNGWTTYPGTRAPAVSNVGGIIRFVGTVYGGSSSVLFNLPSSMAPPTAAYVQVNLANGARGRIVIGTGGSVSVQEPSGLINDAQGLTSLEGAWFSLSSSGYTALTYQNGWSTYGGERAAAVSITNGIIHFQGAIGAASGSNLVPFSLPVGFLPAANAYTPIDLCNGTKGRLNIDPSGGVSISAEGNTVSNATCFTSLEGVSFAQ